MPKTNENSEKQLDMSYAGDCRFAKRLMEPVFFTTLELKPSQCSKNPEGTKELLKAIQDEPRIFATVITDRLEEETEEETDRLLELAVTMTGKPVLCCLAGKNQSVESIAKCFNKYRTQGIRDFIAMTGEYIQDKAKGEMADFPGKYTDATDVLRLGNDYGADTCLGATVNPFKYVQEDLLGQLMKAMRKIHNGARFLVAQAGWDMKKYQELLWFLRSRQVLCPVMARLPMFNYAEADRLGDTWRPGAQIPLFLASAVCKERDTMPLETFTEIQAHRSAFLALGCRLMGYSAIQLADITSAAELKAFLAKFEEMRERYPNFSQWAAAWNKDNEGYSMIPFMPHFSQGEPFYLFDNLLNPDVRDFDIETAKPVAQELQPPTMSDKLQSRLAAPETPEWIKKTAMHWTKWKAPQPDDMTHCLGLNNEGCPKRLTQGPCGGSKVNGICETGCGPCFFQRVTRLAIWNRQIEFLEDNN